MTIYLQHDLTAGEIRRETSRQAAITRNRSKAQAKQAVGAPREMTEMKWHNDPASPAQKEYVENLLKQLETANPGVFAEASTWWGTQRDTINKGFISKVINRIKQRIAEGATIPTATPTTPAAYVRPARDPFTDVPDGYYAVMTDDNVLAFYRVSTWKKSGDRKVQVQASDELHLVKGYKATDAILAKIRRDTPPIAGKRYADELGNCYRCGRTLTDEDSRARGIGPKCASLM